MIVGGLINDSEFQINTSLYVLEFADPFQCLVSVKSRHLPPVFGHTSHVYKCSKTSTVWLLMVGGIVPYCPYSLITMFDLSALNVKTQVRVGGDCLMSNHSSHIFEDNLWIIGGGGFMANFGTFFNNKIKCYKMDAILEATKNAPLFPAMDGSEHKGRMEKKLDKSKIGLDN